MSWRGWALAVKKSCELLLAEESFLHFQTESGEKLSLKEILQRLFLPVNLTSQFAVGPSRLSIVPRMSKSCWNCWRDKRLLGLIEVDRKQVER